MTKKFAFLSGQPLSQRHKDSAAEKGIELIPIRGLNPFKVTDDEIRALAGTDTVGVVVDHPAAFVRLCQFFEIGIFEEFITWNRGSLSPLMAKRLHLYDVTETEESDCPE